MSTFMDRKAARAAPDPAPMAALVPAMVPDHIRAAYADALTRIPSIRLDIRNAAPSRTLPEVGSFYG